MAVVENNHNTLNIKGTLKFPSKSKYTIMNLQDQVESQKKNAKDKSEGEWQIIIATVKE